MSEVILIIATKEKVFQLRAQPDFVLHLQGISHPTVNTRLQALGVGGHQTPTAYMADATMYNATAQHMRRKTASCLKAAGSSLVGVPLIPVLRMCTGRC